MEKCFLHLIRDASYLLATVMDAQAEACATIPQPRIPTECPK